MRLLSADEMRAMDRTAIDHYGLSGLILMENAGRGAAEYFSRFFAELFPGPVSIFCGKGNNGGDGYVIARHLENKGWKIRVVVLAPRQDISGDARTNLEILHRGGTDVSYAPDQESLAAILSGQTASRLIIDAIFGNGLSSDICGHLAEVIDWINASGLPVAAVDMPSGINADSGAVMGRSVRADCSATFAFPKVGQMLYPAVSFGGEVTTIDIGMPGKLMASAADRYRFVDADFARTLLPERPAEGHKGTFGHLLVVAGSTGKSGAAALTAEGGMRGRRVGDRRLSAGCSRYPGDKVDRGDDYSLARSGRCSERHGLRADSCSRGRQAGSGPWSRTGPLGGDQRPGQAPGSCLSHSVGHRCRWPQRVGGKHPGSP